MIFRNVVIEYISIIQDMWLLFTITNSCILTYNGFQESKVNICALIYLFFSVVQHKGSQYYKRKMSLYLLWPYDMIDIIKLKPQKGLKGSNAVWSQRPSGRDRESLRHKKH